MTFASTAEVRLFCFSFDLFAFVVAAGVLDGRGECGGDCGRELLALDFAEGWPLDTADRDADLDKAGEAEVPVLASSQTSSWSPISKCTEAGLFSCP